MDVSLYSAASQFQCWEGAPNLIFCMKIESCSWQKWHRMDHKVPVYAVWSSCKHSYTSNEGYETLKQQWMYLFTAQNHIFSAERVPWFWYFARNLRVVFGRNDTYLTTRSLLMLAEAPADLPIHLMKVMKHSSSNECLSLKHSMTFPVLRGCPKSDILHVIWELFLAEMTHGEP